MSQLGQILFDDCGVVSLKHSAQVLGDESRQAGKGQGLVIEVQVKKWSAEGIQTLRKTYITEKFYTSDSFKKCILHKDPYLPIDVLRIGNYPRLQNPLELTMSLWRRKEMIVLQEHKNTANWIP